MFRILLPELIKRARLSDFWSLTQHVWDVRQLRLSVKLQVYRACVLSVSLYGAESWTITFHCRRKLEAFYTKCLRKISHGGIWDKDRWHLNNQKLRQFLGASTIVQLISQARLRWLGHLAHMSPKRLPKCLLLGFLQGNMWEGRQLSAAEAEDGCLSISSTIWKLLKLPRFHCILGCRKTRARIGDVLCTQSLQPEGQRIVELTQG